MSVSLLPAFQPDSSSRHQYLSGIEIVQDTLTQTTTLSAFGYQTFRLPVDFVRGGSDIPSFTGVQICADTTEPFSANITLEVNEFGDWNILAQGSVSGAAVGDEQEWVTTYFDQPILLNERWLERQFRLGVQTDSPIWYAYPPTLFGETTTVASGNLAFKILANTADAGTDFLGNRYRSMVKDMAVDNTQTIATENQNSFWYSKPNPSKYAVESLYYDVRDGTNGETVTDRILVDPITPGTYFTVYYSSEGGGVTTEAEWEQKLWTPVYLTFKLDRRQEFALPEPISAKYIKVEFTHLQAQHYSPGTFSQPIVYKKHPKWVLDYFLARLNAENFTDDPYIARKVRVVYNALQIGYDYYIDDLHQDPEDPIALPNDAQTQLTSFLSDRTDVSDQVDTNTLDQMRTDIAPYALQPGARTNALSYLLATYNIGNLDPSYPVENKTPAVANTTQVSNLDRQNLVVEANYPVMFFYLPCRHTYRQLQASFENDRAYFVGVRELAFMRDHYTVASDTSTYIENLTDYTNAIRNDFVEQVVDDA